VPDNKQRGKKPARRGLFAILYGFASLFLLAAVVFACVSCLSGTSPDRYNVVLITLDALRPDHMSFYGYERETSPTLDRLAREGVSFWQHITVCSSTTASMSALMTGKFPSYENFIGKNLEDRYEMHLHGFSRFYRDGQSRPGLPDNVVMLAEMLKEAGFTTAGVVSNPYLKKEFNFNQGFDAYEEFSPEDYLPYPKADKINREVVGWLEKNASQQFFLFLHYMDTHFPYNPPAEYKTIFPAEKPGDMSERDISNAWGSMEDRELLKEIKGWMTAQYDGEIRYVDDEIGRLLKEFERLGILDRTIFIITADHGDEFLDHGQTLHRSTLYEELVKVPLIMYCPSGLPRGKAIEGLTRSVDILPTILDLLNVPRPEFVDGSSLAPMIFDGTSDGISEAYMANLTNQGLRTEKWKYIRDHFAETIELYDLENDPKETINLAETQKQITEDMFARLRMYNERFAEEHAELMRGTASEDSSNKKTQIDDETLRQLKALGYIN
jgi:arylsulfatase A-like enzyme